MCGILGFKIQTEKDYINDKLLLEVLQKQSHRGPDFSDFSIIDSQTAVGHNRLSIIDLSERGNQPMQTAEGSVVIVFNGEIYNYKDIREKLITKGYTFISNTDTEVVLKAYSEYGTGLLMELNGMFAFAIYDKREDSFFLARDRFGQKPLFYYYDGEKFIFSSELKAMLCSPALDKSIDYKALDLFLSLQYIPAPYTIFNKIKQLKASEALIFRNNTIKTVQYYDIERDEEVSKLSFDDAKELINEKVTHAVRRRMMSDVPLGTFLSGGIDSSIITSILAKESNAPITTVSVGFNERQYSELDKAKSIADKYKTNHHEYVLSLDNAQKKVVDIISAFGQPFGDSSAIPTWFLSEATRKHVTVALSGDGGDELFSGYKRYSLDRKFNKIQRIVPPFLLKRLFTAMQIVPPRKGVPIDKNWTLGLKRLTQVNSIDRRASILRWGSYFNFAQKQLLYKDYQVDEDIAVNYLVDIFNLRPDINDYSQRTQYSDIYSYTPGDYMVKTDIASMQHSLEVRSPLLDYEVVNTAFSINPKFNMKASKGKKILKAAFDGYLTDDVLYGPKRGFSIPIADWLRESWLDLLNDYLSSANSFCKGIFNMKYIEQLIDDHENNRNDNSKRLYLLLVLEVWLNDN